MTLILYLIAVVVVFFSSIIADCHTCDKPEDASEWSVVYFLGSFLVVGLAVTSVISTTTFFIILGTALAISIMRIFNIKKIIQFIGKIGP